MKEFDNFHKKQKQLQCLSISQNGVVIVQKPFDLMYCLKELFARENGLKKFLAQQKTTSNQQRKSPRNNVQKNYNQSNRNLNVIN